MLRESESENSNSNSNRGTDESKDCELQRQGNIWAGGNGPVSEDSASVGRYGRHSAEPSSAISTESARVPSPSGDSGKRPHCFYKPIFACAASDDDGVVSVNLQRIRSLSDPRTASSITLDDADMVLVAISKGRPRLGRHVILLEMIAQVRNMRGQSGQVSTAERVLRHRIAIFRAFDTADEILVAETDRYCDRQPDDDAQRLLRNFAEAFEPRLAAVLRQGAFRSPDYHSLLVLLAALLLEMRLLPNARKMK